MFKSKYTILRGWVKRGTSFMFATYYTFPGNMTIIAHLESHMTNVQHFWSHIMNHTFFDLVESHDKRTYSTLHFI